LDEEYYRGLIQAFSKQHPTIAVEFLPRTVDQLETLGPGAADVRPVWPMMFGSVRERGDLLALDPVIQIDESQLDLSDLYPGIQQVFAADGQVWAVPVGTNLRMMYYNLDLFDRYGVPYPEIGWTWDDFLDAAHAIRDPDAAVYGYACSAYLHEPMQWVFSHGGQIFDDMQDPTRSTFDNPLTVEAIEWWGGLAREHDVCLTSVEAGGHGSLFRVIREGRVGMWAVSYSVRGGRAWPDGSNAPLRFAWGIVPLPRDRRSTSGALVLGAAISSQTEHPEAAWKWVSFLSNQAREYAAPVRRSVAESAEFEELVGSEVAAAARATLEDDLVIWPASAFTRFGDDLDTLRAAIYDVLAGRRTAQEATDWAQREAEARAMARPTPTPSPMPPVIPGR
jgi:multiple sugar transport system substrate-binding protein